MPWQTPAFWYQPRGLKAQALRPLSWLYAGAALLHRAISRPQRVAVPVLAVGNATAGGGGKTPATIMLVGLLRELGYAPHILSRGYGRKGQGTMRVDVQYHTAEQVGDEPLLLAAHAPCWVAPRRADAARAAIAAGATVLVMDDGLQHYSLHKDVALLCVQGPQGFGNGLVMPAGALRVPLSATLAQADMALCIGDEVAGLPHSLPVFKGEISPLGTLPPADAYAAFAGIARPERFFSMLRSMGANLIHTQRFADHHAFTLAELEALKQRAAGAPLLTTRKDYVRLPEAWRSQVHPVDIALQCHETEALKAQLAALLSAPV